MKRELNHYALKLSSEVKNCHNSAAGKSVILIENKKMDSRQAY